MQAQPKAPSATTIELTDEEREFLRSESRLLTMNVGDEIQFATTSDRLRAQTSRLAVAIAVFDAIDAGRLDMAADDVVAWIAKTRDAITADLEDLRGNLQLVIVRSDPDDCYIGATRAETIAEMRDEIEAFGRSVNASNSILGRTS